MLSYEILENSRRNGIVHSVYTYAPDGTELNCHDFDSRDEALAFVREERKIDYQFNI